MKATAETYTLDSEQIWRQYHDRVQRFVQRRVSDPDVAEDIVQDVFLKVHGRLGTLRDPERLEAWLFQIARYAVIDHYRQRSTIPLEDATALPAEQQEETPVAHELIPCLLAAIERLPERDREALLLVVRDGLRQREVAERQGLSISGAKSRIQRARAKVRGFLEWCCRPQFDRLGGVVDYDPRCPTGKPVAKGCCIEGCGC